MCGWRENADKSGRFWNCAARKEAKDWGEGAMEDVE
jgi:hypothetical protein